MKSLAAKTVMALAAASVPALAVAGILGITLISTVGDVESEVDNALSTALRITEIRVMMEKEHGLVARLPAELDQSRVDAYAAEIAAIDKKLDEAIVGLVAKGGIAAPDTIKQLRDTRGQIAKATAEILTATKGFAQTTALELVNDSFEANYSVAVTLLDAIASNVAAVADAARKSLNDSSAWAWRLTPIALIAALLAVGLGFWTIQRQVVLPLSAIGAGMRRLADNDLTVDTSGWPTAGELGRMTRAVEHFKESAAARQRLQNERQEDFRAAESRNRQIAELAKTFEAEAEAVITSLGAASNALTANAEAMMKAAAENERRAQDVAASTAEANAAANSVAAASEEISTTIHSITERIVAAQSIASEAMTGAQSACDTIDGVVERCQSIGAVIDLIDRIASETNLLALNATIEAARAGEMGRGFGVVAGEVKSLANQTAKATGDVTSQIHALQSASGSGSQAVDKVATTIARMDEIATAIADMMRQQSAATREISLNAQSAASGTTSVLQSIANVTKASQRTRGISDGVGRAALDLAAQAERLAGTVRSFLNGLVAA
jgi:methyl-accepting chemotaxis protein